MRAGTQDMQKDLRQRSETPSRGVLAALWAFMLQSKKWWLTPIMLMLLLLGFLIMAGGTGAAPFIYTLF